MKRLIKTILKFATLYIFLSHSVSSTKCRSNYPVIEVSSELKSLEGKNYPVDYYTIAPQAESFTINCSSSDPVIWDIYSQSATGNVKVSFHYETIRFNQSTETEDGQEYETETETGCHTVSLELFNVSEGVTGLYKCKNINDGFWYEGFPQVFIYGGSNNSNGNLLNRGQSVKLSTEDYDREFTDDFTMTIPCGLNYPGNRTVDIYIEKTTEARSKKILSVSGPPKSGTQKTQTPLYDIFTDVPTSNCYISRVYTCIDFKRLKAKFRASQQLRKGLKVRCKTDKEERGDFVQIEVKSTPVISQVPSERNMTLYVDYKEPITFKCKSTKPIQITTNWNHTQLLKSQYTPKSTKELMEWNSKSSSFWSYQEELTITVPASEHDQSDSELEWQSFEVKVMCATKDSNEKENVSWNYKLINIHGNGYNNREERERIFQMANEDLGCYSKAPNIMSATFVPCSTYNECQLKSKFLFYPESDKNIYTLTNTSIDRNRFLFGIPEETSGLVRCHGFGVDLVAIAYVKLDHYLNKTFKLKGLLTDKKESPSFGDSNPYVASNVTEIDEGDFVSVSCSTPLMLTVSHPLLEFKFRNETQAVIREEFIKSKFETTDGDIFLVAAEVQIPTSEITGISCVNRQHTSFTPMAWSEGLLSEKAETTTEFKRNSVLFKVNARR